MQKTEYTIKILETKTGSLYAKVINDETEKCSRFYISTKQSKNHKFIQYNLRSAMNKVK